MIRSCCIDASILLANRPGSAEFNTARRQRVRIAFAEFAARKMDELLKSRLLDSIAANRLVIFSGAGLSMAPPSKVPNAATLAQACATAYEQQSGEVLRPDCHWNIELLADYFVQRGQLESIFLGRVIRSAGLAPFVRGPNLGHEALGDFLGCGAIELNISTNVDVLTEMAAEKIGEPFRSGRYQSGGSYWHPASSATCEVAWLFP